MLLVVFKTRKKLFPVNLQSSFALSSSDRNNRRQYDFKSKTLRTTISQIGLSEYGGQFEEELTKCSTINKFKTIYKKKKSYKLLT